MRTNIEIDETLITAAMAALKVTTKREAVTQALEQVVSHAERIERQKGMLKWQGKIQWVGHDDPWPTKN